MRNNARSRYHRVNGCSLIDKELRQVTVSARRKFFQDKKLEAANRRRDNFMRLREQRISKINEKKFKKSKRIIHQRWIEENELQRRSFVAKKNDQDQVNLRKVNRCVSEICNSHFLNLKLIVTYKAYCNLKCILEIYLIFSSNHYRCIRDYFPSFINGK